MPPSVIAQLTLCPALPAGDLYRPCASSFFSAAISLHKSDAIFQPGLTDGRRLAFVDDIVTMQPG